MKEKRITNNNPNKANQWRPDPRQSLFLQNYLNPESETFSNALQSALKAGYKKEYAESITDQMPTWLSEGLGDDYMLKKAESNLKEFLEMDTINESLTKSGIKVSYDDPKLKKIKADISTFVAERIGKSKWSQKYEHKVTGAIGIVALIGQLEENKK
jgi:hypothetical protein